MALLTPIQQYWNAFSKVYTAHHEKHTRPIVLQLIMNLQMGKAKRVLEVGAASGKSTLELSRLAAPDCQIVASDYAPELLEILRQSVSGCSNVSTRLVDARKLPFDDESFDRYLAGFVIHLVPNYSDCIHEAARVLKPGGLAAFSIWGREDASPIFTLPGKIAEKAFGPDFRAQLKPPAFPGHSNFDCARDPDALMATFRQAGFRRVIYWYTSDAAVNFANAAEFAEQFGELPSWRQLFNDSSDDEPERFRALIAEAIEELTEQHRSLQFEAMCILASK